MGLLEKRRFRNFLVFVNEYDAKDPKTHKGELLVKSTTLQIYLYPLTGVPPETLMKDVFKKYSLDENIASFTGHAIACYRNDE